VIAVVNASPRAKKSFSPEMRGYATPDRGFCGACERPKKLLSAFRAAPRSGSGRKQRKNMEDRNGGHLSERNAEAKNDPNIKSREDRTAFGHTQ
jgi:hypothetical protein